jgi:hypothetical protein
VDNTTYWGEQIGKTRPSLIRRRFVPALTETLMAKAEKLCQMVKAGQEKTIIS